MTEQAKQFYDQVEEIVRKCQDGEPGADVLLTLATIKQMDKVLKAAKERVEPVALKALGEEKSYAHHGYIFTKTNGRKKWKYDNCPSHVEVVKDLKKIEAQLQANYRYMESNGALSANSETGEIGEIPVLEYGDDFVTVKEAKR